MSASAPTAPSSAQLHVGTWLLGAGPEPVRRGAVAVAQGRVLAAGPAERVLADLRRSGAAVEEIGWEAVLVPGLVNAHTHLQYTCMEEVGRGTYRGFEDWGEAFQRLYTQPHDWAAATADGLDRVVASGTTAVADVVTDPEALRLQQRARVHGVSYWEVMGWLERTWLERGREATTAHLTGDPSEDLAAHPHPLLGLSPHAPYSLDTEVIRDVGRLASRLGVRRHMHLAESAWEAEYVAHGTGDLAERWRGWGYGDFHLLRAGGVRLRPVAYAESIGALGPDVHVAHGIYVDADDRAILRRTGTTVALCPRSNAVIGLDEPPVAAYLREGNGIAVGTDSLSSSPSLDLLGDVAALHRIARAQGYGDRDLPARLLHAATTGGAAAMGLDAGDHRLGVLEPGAVADLAAFDVGGASGEDVLAALVTAGEGTCTGTVIAGEVRWDRSNRTAGSPSAAASTVG